jgi:PIN domain nuclease of toxin-antitoxin system
VTVAPLLDTHAWIWWMDHDPRLRRTELNALDNLADDNRPRLCDISLWEVATLVELNRLSFTIPFAEWVYAAAHPRAVQVLPITAAIAAEVAALPKAFHRDPADRVIVATSRVMRLAVLTRDHRITRSRLIQRWIP